MRRNSQSRVSDDVLPIENGEIIQTNENERNEIDDLNIHESQGAPNTAVWKC